MQEEGLQLDGDGAARAATERTAATGSNEGGAVRVGLKLNVERRLSFRERCAALGSTKQTLSQL